ncbi:hypothetical protein P4O66_014438 [Electrophorus voltai]|uniref:WWE domain-containing protein n=1 Tax=Electrophorus voltai TaxID=2609070 RepID=A0AAD9DRJ7_9TELE|nr:protein mono-ADP-ribosyltransferase PARP12 isoform X1 [Electrophorus electricus]KAK1790563.1 hypothetical protein P4O66_014438 [Electrophorus voltai]
MNAIAKPYEWHLFDGQQWSSICNDHIIESHYCQPGARGMTIDTHLGALYIDFDAMTVRGPFAGLGIRREMLLSHNQTQEVGWYFKDNSYWQEYGTQGTSSVNSQTLEQWYNTNPEGSFQFTVGRSTYVIDFSAMTQTRRSTHVLRKVRRRPKFNSSVFVNDSLFTDTPSPLSTSINSSMGITWEFMGEEGIWTEYQKPGCSLDSIDIENQYQLNPHGQLTFTAGRYSYTLEFSEMFQINSTFGTKRHVRRTTGENHYNSSALSQIQWQYNDENGYWKDYVKGSARGSCTISSQDIERQYQQNSTGSMSFRTGRFNYILDFSAMIQTNMSTQTKRPVRRLLQ